MKSNFTSMNFTKLFSILSLLLVLLFLSNKSFSQIQVIMDASADGQTFTGCEGGLIDSGGNGPNDYDNNEDVTVTICPDIPGELITLSFTLFNLSLNDDNPNPNQTNVDYFSIWDGDNATGPPTLGSYTGTQLANQTGSATSANPTGCLTINFTSNTIGTGNFAAQMSCSTPGDSPRRGRTLWQR